MDGTLAKIHFNSCLRLLVYSLDALWTMGAIARSLSSGPKDPAEIITIHHWLHDTSDQLSRVSPLTSIGLLYLQETKVYVFQMIASLYLSQFMLCENVQISSTNPFYLIMRYDILLWFPTTHATAVLRET